MAIADFAGGMNAVKQQLWQRQIAEMEMQQRAAEQQARMQQTTRGLDLEERGLGLREAQFDAELNAPPPPDKPIVVGGRLVMPSGQVVFEPPPEAPKPERPITLSPGSVLADPTGARIMLRNPAAQAEPTQEPLVPVIGDDGRPVLMPRSRAAGRQPASTREQTGNRPITSGDAGRMADFDTSLDDLGVLKGALDQTDATGTLAKIGAMVPNFVTEFTGFGSGAKQKQALIDRVKQVIGKTLEGGVLRKEDEIKYEKILPTIGDPDEIVAAKLKGLEEAIGQRKGRFTDALSDAGYDTSRFQTHQPPSAGGAAPKPIRQRNARTGQVRISMDGGKTWQLQ